MQRDRRSQTDAAYYQAVIKQHPLFSKWSTETLSEFAPLWTVVNYEPGKAIVKEGSQIDNVYIIIAGNCEVTTHDKVDPSRIHTLAILSPGESIGLSSTGLFSSTSERTANVIALSKVSTITIKLKELQKFLNEHPNLNSTFETSLTRIFRLQLAKECIPFAKLDAVKLNEIADKIEELTVGPNEIIFKEGDDANVSYLLAEGQVEISKNIEGEDVVLANLKPTAIFGEVAIIFNMKRNATAITQSEVKLFCLARDVLTKLFTSQSAFAASLSRTMLNRCLPTQTPNLAERHEVNIDKSKRVVLKNLKTKEYYILNEESYFAWTFMDGRTSLETIIKALNTKFGGDKTDDTIALITDLHRHGFIKVTGYRFPRENSQGIWGKIISFINPP